MEEELNFFFVHVKVDSAHHNQQPTTDTCSWWKKHEVSCTLRVVNLRKAAEPDGNAGQVLKDCTDWMSGVFTRMFNQSLSQSSVPPCLKSSIMVLLPKKTTTNGLNE